jgi:hypothetical protein
VGVLGLQLLHALLEGGFGLGRLGDEPCGPITPDSGAPWPCRPGVRLLEIFAPDAALGMNRGLLRVRFSPSSSAAQR